MLDLAEEMKIKQQVFLKFCNILESIGSKLIATEKPFVEAAEERFGYWLHKCPTSELSAKYADFAKEIEDSLQAKTIVQNPCYLLHLAAESIQ